MRHQVIMPRGMYRFSARHLGSTNHRDAVAENERLVDREVDHDHNLGLARGITFLVS